MNIVGVTNYTSVNRTSRRSRLEFKIRTFWNLHCLIRWGNEPDVQVDQHVSRKACD